MTLDKEKYIQERYAEYEKKWAENPAPPRVPIVDTEREKVPVNYNVPASAFDFEEKEGHTTYGVAGTLTLTREKTFFRKFGE